MSDDKCPVDHGSLNNSCPVDHTTRSTWSKILPHSSDTLSESVSPPPSTTDGSGSSSSSSINTTKTVPVPTNGSLSTSRELSSIPRGNDNGGGNWVYPSEAQFYAAMARKKHDPRAPDMKVVVPIHNAVNERAWSHIKEWEAGRGGERCGGVRLVSFKGRPGEPSPKARILTLLGYNPPFDRHDWIVDRCGTRVRYVIDFYAGRTLPGTTSNVSFFLDVRPALDSWEAVSMRTSMFMYKWTHIIRDTFSGSSSLPPPAASSGS